MIRSIRAEPEEVQHCSKGQDGAKKGKTLEGGWDGETSCNSMVNSMKGLPCGSENTAREVATTVKWPHVVTEGKQICAHIGTSMHVKWDTFKGLYWTSSLTQHQVGQALSLLHRSCERHLEKQNKHDEKVWGAKGVDKLAKGKSVLVCFFKYITWNRLRIETDLMFCSSGKQMSIENRDMKINYWHYCSIYTCFSARFSGFSKYMDFRLPAMDRKPSTSTCWVQTMMMNCFEICRLTRLANF